MKICVEGHPLEAAVPGTNLAEFLARSGHPLNTRCNQRGVCGGCEVFFQGSSVPVKACRHELKEGDCLDITVPPRSMLRHPPVAVSDFETLVPAATNPLLAGRLGLALDLGTTTVALLLAELEGGRILARATALNAQAALGDNVLSRIQACQDDPANLGRLQADFWEKTFRPLLKTVLSTAAVKTSDIGGLVVAGNTTMLHLACGADPTPLGRVPFRPAFLSSREFSGAEFGLPAEWAVVFLPGLSAFVGADITAGAVCCGLAYPDRPMLFVDVGTNGEILLALPEGSVATATAAGPAFEGCGLLSGMRAAPGAIGHLTIERQGLEVSLEVIGENNRAAEGIAGSAYVDFLAEGRRSGLLTETGRFAPEALKNFPSRFATGENGRDFLLTAGTKPVRVGEVDIALLLQAKAAIAAGIETLLAKKNLAPSQLATVFLAGGFGRHLSISNALACGLLPGFREDQIRVVGNTALGGAYLAMLDRSLLEEMSSLRAETLELNEDPGFEDRFLENLCLP